VHFRRPVGFLNCSSITYNAARDVFSIPITPSPIETQRIIRAIYTKTDKHLEPRVIECKQKDLHSISSRVLTDVTGKKWTDVQELEPPVIPAFAEIGSYLCLAFWSAYAEVLRILNFSSHRQEIHMTITFGDGDVCALTHTVRTFVG
jgi:hypothetical protein